MEKTERKNLAIALNALYSKNKKIYPMHVSKDNTNREKQIILLITPNREGCHYIAIKNSSVWLRGITSKHHGDFYCLNCLHFFATENKRESQKKGCENQDFCSVEMPSEIT